MNRYVIASVKSWNIDNYKILKKQYPDNDFRLVCNKADLNLSFLKAYDPSFIFFPHWSWIIPEEIYKNFNCVVFHSTDLPFGRGGSPIQNLILRGIYDTKITALKVDASLDGGPIYFKEPVDLSEGNIEDILKKISDIIFYKMIPRFFYETLEAYDQEGEIVFFKRRKPEQSLMPEEMSQRQIYDFIRMLDGEGYPPAFRNYKNGKIFFSNAKMERDVVLATAKFVENNA